MKVIKYFFGLWMIMFLHQACYYDNEEDLYPESTNCDTTNITYTETIAPLMENNCNSCHNAVTPNANVITDNYTDLKVIAGNGQLWGAVNHESGFSPMPKNQDKLSDCELTKIRKWLDDGAPDN
ncbi:MAG: hypothetical protein ACOCQ6_02280 [Bacteroidota bacterium]